MDQGPTLGQAIRRRREDLGLTQEALAARIGFGMTQSDISRIERGRVHLPRRERLDQISRALGLSLGELLARSGWVGAEQAFGPLRIAPQQAQPPPRAAPGTTRPRSVPPPAVETGSIRLHEAILQSERLRARTAELIAQAKAAYRSGWEPVSHRDAGDSFPGD